MSDLLKSPVGSIPHIIAHRGARSIAPENTIPAIRRALEMGCRGIEFDIDVSADGRPVVVHQETLQPDRTGQVLELALSDLTRAWTMQMSAEQICQLDAGSWFASEFSNVKVPSLEDVLALPWGRTCAVAELKDPFFWANPENRDSGPRIVTAVAPAIDRFLASGGDLLLLSFSPQILELCQARFPDVPRVLAVWTDQTGKIDRILNLVKKYSIQVVTLADSMVVEDPAWVTRLHDVGAQVWVYDVTPDNFDTYREWRPENRATVWQSVARLGVDAIESDFPEELQQILHLLDKDCRRRPPGSK
jgi:glycerophosphoryl diester phosphodiesterase